MQIQKFPAALVYLLVTASALLLLLGDTKSFARSDYFVLEAHTGAVMRRALSETAALLPAPS